MRRYAMQDFVEQSMEDYMALLKLLGHEWRNLKEAAEFAEHTILRDFGSLYINMDQPQLDDLFVILDRMGFYRASKAPAGGVDHVVFTGDTLPNMVKLLKLGGAVKRDAFAMYGQHRWSYATDGSASEIDNYVKKHAPSVLKHPWYLAEKERKSYTMWDQRWGTRHELGILAALIASKGKYMVTLSLPPTDGFDIGGEVPPRTIGWTILQHRKTGATLNIYNPPAVATENFTTGKLDFRPTSTSCAQHWLRTHHIDSGSRIGVVTNDTSWRRVVGNTEASFHAIDPSLEVYAIAPAIDPSEPNHNHALKGLREAARSLAQAHRDLVLDRARIKL